MTKVFTGVYSNVFHRFSIVLLLLVGPKAHAQPTLDNNFGHYSNLKGHALRGQSRCAEIFALPGQMTTARLVSFQAQLMSERRKDFSEEFNLSRVDVAYAHWDRSLYFYTLSEGELVSTFGLTFSDYDSSTRAFSPIPEEDTLKRSVERPLSHSGTGFIVECRTYGMLPKFRADAFPVMLKMTLEALEPRLRSMPDLRDAKIIHTYGGREGVIMYKAMGFEVVDPEPVIAYGEPMWRLRSSPNALAARVAKVSNLEHVAGFHVPIPLKLSSTGASVTIAPGGSAALTQQSDGKSAMTHFREPTDDIPLPSGIVAAKGAEVWGAGAPFPSFVSKIAQKYEYGDGIAAAEGSAISLMGRFGLIQLTALDRTVKLGSMAYAEGGSRLEFTIDRKHFYIFRTANDVTESSGRLVPAGRGLSVTIHSDGTEERREFDPSTYVPNVPGR